MSEGRKKEKKGRKSGGKRARKEERERKEKEESELDPTTGKNDLMERTFGGV